MHIAGAPTIDDARFDALAKHLAGGTSRRTLLRGIAGLTGAGVIGRGGVAANACRGEGHPCAGNQVCCAGLICVEAASPGHAARCVLEPPPQPCGAVGDACSTGGDCCTPNVCADGSCAAACPPGSRDCDGVCYPGGCCSDSDCGGACLVCGSDHVCRTCADSGQCLTCDTSTGTCVDGCPTGWVCQGGQCVVDCPASTTVCFVSDPQEAPPTPTCCGDGAMCDSCSPGGDCICVPSEGGSGGYFCPPPQYACCGTNSNGTNTCVCCTSGQTCDTSVTAGACSG